MDTRSEQNNQQASVVDGQHVKEISITEDLISPGVTIVRDNTPPPRTPGLSSARADQLRLSRQSSPHSSAEFPSAPPEAPSLPEDYDDGEAATSKPIELVPLQSESKQESRDQEPSGFLWLFEYGLEIESAYLNSPERLNGQAFTYGPAVLNGYRILPAGVEVRPGQVAATIVPTQQSDAAVWGILYRIPRCLAERNGEELSLLDKIHGATVFAPLEVTVQEIYRKRAVTCLTYIAPITRQGQSPWSPSQYQEMRSAYAQQLLAYAARQQLPGNYLTELKEFVAAGIETREKTVVGPVERNTEPLPIVKGTTDTDSVKEKSNQPGQDVLPADYPARWLTAFALYLVLLLLATLTLAFLQALGYGNTVLAVNFTVLAVPWYVLVYGLLGACVSGILTLRKQTIAHPPGFVMMTWFARPYIGVILAALAYLLLNSGLVVIGGNAGQHYALNALVGALAGFGEGWVYFRKVSIP
ncbi:MAG TPA: gamma-glutamylcyclotransferase family protein [Ktedonobacteraceae bacterium]|nr:gamma-glutamylcyclotransferase family protein [Ktedonobacteraceae bacterium]